MKSKKVEEDWLSFKSINIEDKGGGVWTSEGPRPKSQDGDMRDDHMKFNPPSPIKCIGFRRVREPPPNFLKKNPP